MAKKNSMAQAASALSNLTEAQLAALQFTMPWQYDTDAGGYKDPDGFQTETKQGVTEDRKTLQVHAFNKFHDNPQINTAIRGIVGRLAGFGFEITSEVGEIQEVIEETEFDWRNRLYNFWPKYIGRSVIEGELFLCLTLHLDGFVEVDFVDPSVIGGTGVDAEDGIIYHPTKTLLPLIYCIEDGKGNKSQIPSIYVARNPELLSAIEVDDKQLAYSKNSKKAYSKIGGFYKFIVAWDKSFVTRRNIPYLKTVILWLNHYENLKKYEIDHKKSAGAYLWIVTIEDPKSFRIWLSLSDSERRKTGILAKKTPGSTLVLPPGMKAQVINPNLPNIRESDTDILHMVTSGLNEPEDISTGQSKGTYASLKASRAPMTDRVSDEIAYLDRFLKYDFYSSVFFLRSTVTSFPTLFKRREAVDFKDNEPVFEYVKKKPEFLVDIAYPTSELTDAEARARAFLGVKHGSTYDTLGIPNAEIAKKMGFGNYKKLRLQQETEKSRYPELITTVDDEGVQEKTEAEPGKKRLIKRKKKEE